MKLGLKDRKPELAWALDKTAVCPRASSLLSLCLCGLSDRALSTALAFQDFFVGEAGSLPRAGGGGELGEKAPPPSWTLGTAGGLSCC